MVVRLGVVEVIQWMGRVRVVEMTRRGGEAAFRASRSLNIGQASLRTRCGVRVVTMSGSVLVLKFRLLIKV